MSKATLGSLIALTLSMSLAGCAKKEQPPAEAAAPAGSQAPTAQPQMPAEHPAAKAAAEVDLTGLAKAEGGKTVAEVFAEKDALASQKVAVRGKVVKANSGIMNLDWLHVRDGSGADGANDLTVTTTTSTTPSAKVGDTVVVTGTVALNKDFGMGYQYPVILENAEVKVEASAP